MRTICPECKHEIEVIEKEPSDFPIKKDSIAYKLTFWYKGRVHNLGFETGYWKKGLLDMVLDNIRDSILASIKHSKTIKCSKELK